MLGRLGFQKLDQPVLVSKVGQPCSFVSGSEVPFNRPVKSKDGTAIAQKVDFAQFGLKLKLNSKWQNGKLVSHVLLTKSWQDSRKPLIKEMEHGVTFDRPNVMCVEMDTVACVDVGETFAIIPESISENSVPVHPDGKILIMLVTPTQLKNVKKIPFAEPGQAADKNSDRTLRNQPVASPAYRMRSKGKK